MVALQADAIFACLESHGVRYVLIGGLAAVLHGSPQTTLDADICPAGDNENLVKLAAALRDMHARIRTPDVSDGLAFACDEVFLGQVQILNLVTDYGDLDLSFMPAGTQGFADIAGGAATLRIQGHSVQVASLEDVIRSKEAANRPKDRAALPILNELLHELKNRDSRRNEPH